MTALRPSYFFTALFICSTFCFSLQAKEDPTTSTYALDTETSVVKWTGKKVSGAHNGTLKIKSGNVEKSGDSITGGEFVIDMTTIVNEDIENLTWRKKLEDHLRSDDFFNISKFPEGKFVINKTKNNENGSLLIHGDLTIKDITKPITFEASLKEEAQVMHANATTKINRLEWDIRYNSAKWFDPQKLGDKLIYDDIEIELDLKTK